MLFVFICVIDFVRVLKFLKGGIVYIKGIFLVLFYKVVVDFLLLFTMVFILDKKLFWFIFFFMIKDKDFLFLYRG